MEKKERIGALSTFALIAVAVLFDAIQFLFSFLNVIPVVGNAIAFVVNWFIAILAAIIFALWFKLLGVDYFNGKRAGRKLLAMLGSLVVELIPIIDALPAITVGVVVLILTTKAEDKELLSVPHHVTHQLQRPQRTPARPPVKTIPNQENLAA